MKNRQQDRIELLKKEIRDVTGEEMVHGVSPDCPHDVEEAFLSRVLWFEKTLRQPLKDRLEGAGIVLVDPESLDDDDLTRRMWEAIHGLLKILIVPTNTDHLSDREVYACLWSICSRGEAGVIPELFSRGWYIDFSGSGEDGIEQYLQYYASDDERRVYQRQYPDRPLPDKSAPPHNRDRFIPDPWPEPPAFVSEMLKSAHNDASRN